MTFSAGFRVDTQARGNMIGVVPEEGERRGASRYDAIIATFVGLCALCVSGYTAYDKERNRVTVEICYSSTLGECWTVHAGGPTSKSTTTATRHCPTPSEISFQQ